jgi:sugar-specific transcriptional regulator TrmB
LPSFVAKCSLNKDEDIRRKYIIMEKRLKKRLQEIGIPERMCALYLVLMRGGVSGASKLSRKLDRPKSSILDDLRWMSTQGYIASHKRKNQYYFSADPKLLKRVFARKRRDIENLEERASVLASELKTMYHTPTKKPQIEYYEGKSGVKSAFNDILNYPGVEMIGYGDIDSELQTLPKFFPEFYDRRTKKRIGGRGILPITPKTLMECMKNDHIHARDSHFVELDKHHKIGIYVYGDNISIISLEELYAVIIRSRVTARCLKDIFEFAFVEAKKEDRAIRKRVKEKGLKAIIEESRKQLREKE